MTNGARTPSLSSPPSGTKPHDFQGKVTLLDDPTSVTSIEDQSSGAETTRMNFLDFMGPTVTPSMDSHSGATQKVAQYSNSHLTPPVIEAEGQQSHVSPTTANSFSSQGPTAGMTPVPPKESIQSPSSSVTPAESSTRGVKDPTNGKTPAESPEERTRRVKRNISAAHTQTSPVEGPAAAQSSPVLDNVPAAEDEENRASIGGKTPSSQNSEPGGHGGGGQDKGVRKFTGGKVGHEWSDQHLLYNDLFKNYNKHIRPILNHDDVLTVRFEIALFNVLNLDSKAGVMVTNTEMIMIWKDPYLTWNPEDYNQTTTMRVLYSDVWHPDIILYNTADTSYETSLIHTNIIISYDGTCKLQIHAVFTSVCDIDIQWFPFDQQSCDMVFSSWTSDIDQIELLLGPSDISRFHPNHEFFMENFYAESKQDFNPCCERPFSMIVYHIQLQRRVKFALFFFITPGVLINICALLVFSLPAETGEKIGLGINSMLAMMVFLMAMTENLPPTEDLPLAGVYYGVCLIVLTFNILFSVYVLNLSYSGDRGYPVPLWFRYWTVFCARMVRMKIPKFIVGAWNLDENLRIRKDQVEPLSDDDDDEDVKKNFDVRVIKVNPATIEEKTDVFKDPFQRRSIEALEGIHRLLSKEATDHKAQLKKTSLMEQWRYLSRVMDRFLFILFGIGTLLFNTIILTQSPFGEKFEYCPHGFGMCSDDYSFDSSSSEAGHF